MSSTEQSRKLSEQLLVFYLYKRYWVNRDEETRINLIKQWESREHEIIKENLRMAIKTEVKLIYQKPRRGENPVEKAFTEILERVKRRGDEQRKLKEIGQT